MGEKVHFNKDKTEVSQSPCKDNEKKKMKTKLDEKNIPMVIHDYVIKKFKLMR